MYLPYSYNVKALFCAVALILFGCQTVVIPPAEFPTINTEKDLHVVVRMNKGDSTSLHYQFKEVLLEALTELQYPGEVVVHSWPKNVEDTFPQIFLTITRWELEVGGQTCAFNATLVNEGEKTSVGYFRGKNTDSAATMADYQQKGYDLAAKYAVMSFYEMFLPYTNMEE